ncbi:hypothetical protein LJB89_04500, partial [Tyzzerella sp. OttesenSCG-928-J15]|nr:hypothetical protein [Tyzzerella sp. OttesenSCG-928-J15]
MKSLEAIAMTATRLHTGLHRRIVGVAKAIAVSNDFTRRLAVNNSTNSTNFEGDDMAFLWNNYSGYNQRNYPQNRNYNAAPFQGNRMPMY